MTLSKLLLVGWDIAGIYTTIKTFGLTAEACLIAACITIVLGWLIYIT